MKPTPQRKFVIDDIARALRASRKPGAAPLLTPSETIACALNYAMQFEFWKYEISEDSLVVRAIGQALKSEGYKVEAK